MCLCVCLAIQGIKGVTKEFLGLQVYVIFIGNTAKHTPTHTQTVGVHDWKKLMYRPIRDEQGGAGPG